MKLKFDFETSSYTAPDIQVSLDGLDAAFKDLDALVLTSKDPFLSEYVPIENNARYGATRFKGSTGDAIYFTKKFRASHPGVKPVALFVDGRYHLQADQETNPAVVEVVKLDCEPNIEGGVLKRLNSYSGIKIGMDFERTSVSALERFRNQAKEVGSTIHAMSGTEVLEALKLPGWKVDRPIFSVRESDTGRSFSKTVKALQTAMKTIAGHDDTIHVTAATDDAAFLLNARGYHLPSTASFLAYTFVVKNEVILFLPASSKACEVKIDPAQIGDYQFTVVRDSLPELKAKLKAHSVTRAFFNGATMNALLPDVINEVYPFAKIQSDFTWILKTRAQKTNEEMDSIRKSFLRSSQAIARTLRFAKKESQIRDFSEVELSKTMSKEFAAEGAVSLSFKTISGAGPNSAIVHYGSPSEKVFFKKGDIALLDCGAYYEEGFCTDTTRGYYVGTKDSGQKPQAWQTEIYTATLKAAIQVFIKPVDAKLSGKEVDSMIRGQVKNAGYDYMHGTGHGIGIHVHEEGIRLSTLSIYPQSAHACVSVEPGIYLEGKGGVRVENVALLQPEGSTHYRYENVVFVGYDWDLIDLTKLTPAEASYLKDYEAKCKSLGTNLTECPL